MKNILDIQLKEVQGRLVERKMTLDIDEDAKSFLCATGYSPIYGTGPLNGAIKNDLLNPLSVMILSGQVCNEETIRVTSDALRKRLAIVPNHEGTVTDKMRAALTGITLIETATPRIDERKNRYIVVEGNERDYFESMKENLDHHKPSSFELQNNLTTLCLNRVTHSANGSLDNRSRFIS